MALAAFEMLLCNSRYGISKTRNLDIPDIYSFCPIVCGGFNLAPAEMVFPSQVPILGYQIGVSSAIRLSRSNTCA
jgi:hypothetical protein